MILQLRQQPQLKVIKMDQVAQPLYELWSMNPDGNMVRIALTWSMQDCELMKFALEAMYGNLFDCVKETKPNV